MIKRSTQVTAATAAAASLVTLYWCRTICELGPNTNHAPKEAPVITQVYATPTPDIFTVSYDEDAEYLAKLLYGCVRYRSRAVQEAVLWCALNRVDASIYPNSVKEVVQQQSQWQGYSDENPVTDDLYDVALDVLTTWRTNGHRSAPADCLFMLITNNGVELRTRWDGGGTYSVEG